mgnify:CR=1 FL=1
MPLAEMNRYSTALSSLTSGSGTYSLKFAEYAQVPGDVQTALLKAYEEQEKEEELTTSCHYTQKPSFPGWLFFITLKYPSIINTPLAIKISKVPTK